MRDEGIHSRSKANRRRSESREPEIVIQDHIFMINESKMMSTVREDSEYEIVVEESDTISNGRHLDGYRDGDDESDKYFCPFTGAHFEFSEITRKLKKVLRRRSKGLSLKSSNKLSLWGELTKTSLEADLKTKDMMNTKIFQTQNSIGTVISTMTNPKDLEIRTIETLENSKQSKVFDKENSYQDQFKLSKKSHLNQLGMLGSNFATEDLKIVKKQASPLGIYAESGTFDEFCKSINGKFSTSMIKGEKNKRILIPKNSIKTPSKSSKKKGLKGKVRKGAESCRIEKYLKNAEKFSYPGSSLSIQHAESTQLSTIDSKKMKIFQKNKIFNSTNLSKMIKKKKYSRKMKSGEYRLGSEINLTNCKNYDRVKIKGLFKSKCIPVKTALPHNNKRKSSSKSKSKSKGPKVKYQLSSYAVKLKKGAKKDPSLNGLSTREKSSKVSHIFDFNLVNNFKSVPKKKVTKRSLEKKAFKKLNFKKKLKQKTTFDFANVQGTTNTKKEKVRSKSRSKKRQSIEHCQ
ncbi:unnamed protein product [Moneuplotes crassus]|uniref:Uncharacterized protein n=1 Tax=Euplotes crassus TaxID=5936 RepID=A0AAD2D8V7_EUPCR|nr:unnamed protein product [Moneuplotes crassus]